jgi:DNA (cytosine-5)-methyltransferase 1
MEPIRCCLKSLPTSCDEAIKWLTILVRAADTKMLCDVSDDEFKRGWYSLGFLYPGLHPDSALEHGTEISDKMETCSVIYKIEPRLIVPFYTESGWPVSLAPVAEEAWRRYEAGDLQDEEFYCAEAAIAGMSAQNTVVSKEGGAQENL